MSTNVFLTIVNGIRTVAKAISASVGAEDAGKIVATGSNGKIDMSLMPTGLGTNTRSREFTEAVAAGDFINEYDVSGTTKARKADAANSRPATGYVTAAVSSAATGTVYPLGTANDQLSGLTTGTVYVLSNTTAGGVLAASAPTYSNGQIRQELGRAISTTTLDTYDSGTETWSAS